LLFHDAATTLTSHFYFWHKEIKFQTRRRGQIFRIYIAWQVLMLTVVVTRIVTSSILFHNDMRSPNNVTLQYLVVWVVLITNLMHFIMCLFHFSTCFEQHSVHHQENQLYQYIIWYISPAYQTATYTEWYIPDDVLIQFILLMMNIMLLETCREVK